MRIALAAQNPGLAAINQKAADAAAAAAAAAKSAAQATSHVQTDEGGGLRDSSCAAGSTAFVTSWSLPNLQPRRIV